MDWPGGNLFVHFDRLDFRALLRNRGDAGTRLFVESVSAFALLDDAGAGPTLDRQRIGDSCTISPCWLTGKREDTCSARLQVGLCVDTLELIVIPLRGRTDRTG